MNIINNFILVFSVGLKINLNLIDGTFQLIKQFKSQRFNNAKEPESLRQNFSSVLLK